MSESKKRETESIEILEKLQNQIDELNIEVKSNLKKIEELNELTDFQLSSISDLRLGLYQKKILF